jgi:hypothetical protein
MKRFKFLIPLSLCILATTGLIAVFASDHSEAPGTKADISADIADLYAWHEGNKLVAVLTYGGLQATTADQKANYDKDVLYTVHIDNNADNTADIDINVRFGQNAKGEWGMQVENLPGSTGTLNGQVETLIDAGNGLSVFSGLKDDPFFFDLEGFKETLATGTLSFNPKRDSVAGLNVSSIMLEMDLAAASNGSDNLALWATTGRK